MRVRVSHLHGSSFGKFLFALYFVECTIRYLNVYFRHSQVVVQFNDGTLD